MSISSTLRLNANELDNNFVESIKTLFKGKDIEIVTKVIDKEFEKEKLEYQQALKDVEAGIVLELDEDYWKNIDKYIEKWKYYSEKFNMDLKSILDFISEDSKKNAKQFAKDLREIINQIPPFLYKYRQSIYFDNISIRDCMFKGYVIPYKISKNSITLLGITKYKENL